METTLNIITILLAVSITAGILLQVKGIGSGFFGEAYSTFRTRRGFEQTLFRGTLIMMVVFVGLSLARFRIL